MQHRRPSHQLRSRARMNGTAAVELAIVLPLLLLLVFGCIDFGRVAYYATALDNSVGCGSHYAATHRFTDCTFETWEKRVREAVADDMQGVPGFDRNALRVSVAIDENTSTAVREFCQAVRQASPNADTPIFYCSAKHYELDTEAIRRELRISRFVLKPFSCKQLVEWIRLAIDGSSPPNALELQSSACD